MCVLQWKLLLITAFVYRNAPNIDLVLISHGDLAHSGLFAYAYAHWNLRAPAYTTLPVQAMARISATEDVEGLRDEEEFSDLTEPQEQDSAQTGNGADCEEKPKPPSRPRKYVATIQEVHEAFDSITVLRYSQPCHLQGTYSSMDLHP